MLLSFALLTSSIPFLYADFYIKREGNISTYFAVSRYFDSLNFTVIKKSPRCFCVIQKKGDNPHFLLSLEKGGSPLFLGEGFDVLE
jgi:hypothetical protein